MRTQNPLKNISKVLPQRQVTSLHCSSPYYDPPQLLMAFLLQLVVIKEGTLTKLGEVRKSWKKRYFVLTPTSLDYYKTGPGVYVRVNQRHAGAAPASKANCNAYPCVFTATTPSSVSSNNSSLRRGRPRVSYLSRRSHTRTHTQSTNHYFLHHT